MKPVSDTQFACPACDATYQQRPGIEGRKVRCKCGYVGVVPSALAPTGPESAKRRQQIHDKAGTQKPTATHAVESDRSQAGEGPTSTMSELRAIAVAQRWLITFTRLYVVLIFFGPIPVLSMLLFGALAVLGFALGLDGSSSNDSSPSELAGALMLAIGWALVFLMVAIVIFIAQLASRIYKAGIDVVLTMAAGLSAACAFVALLPVMVGMGFLSQLHFAVLAILLTINLILVVVINRKASCVLRDNGIKIGFTGADLAQFKAVHP